MNLVYIALEVRETMHFNYVFFIEPMQYNRIVLYDAVSSGKCVVRETGILPDASRLKRQLYRFHTSQNLSKKGLRLPFRALWNGEVLGNLAFAEEKPLCFVFCATLRRYADTDLFRYIKRQYSDAKVVLLLRDVVEVTTSPLSGNGFEYIERTFDRIYSINEFDVQQYGFHPINVMCSQYPVPENPAIEPSDVVFVGKVKDRAETINRLYQRFTEAGLKCDFTVMADSSQKNILPGIHTSDSLMSYEEMLQRTVKAKCILEVTQKNISSVSSRYLEALCYNKKLISDVKKISGLKFYNPHFMQLFDRPEDIDIDFIKRDEAVDYHYDGYYSPLKLLESIDEDLCADR